MKNENEQLKRNQSIGLGSYFLSIYVVWSIINWLKLFVILVFIFAIVFYNIDFIFTLNDKNNDYMNYDSFSTVLNHELEI